MTIAMKHLLSRKCDASLYNVSFGEVITFPLYNFGKHRTGFITYRPGGPKRVQNAKEGRYYTYITPGEVGVFGLESLNFSNRIFLVGGLFKATALHRLGLTALHVSSVSYKNLKPQLGLLGRPVTAIGDNDKEGEDFASIYGGFTSYKDLDEMEENELWLFLSRMNVIKYPSN